MTLVKFNLTPDEAVVVSEAVEQYIDGLTTAYGKHFREKLSAALSADASIDDAIADAKTDDSTLAVEDDPSQFPATADVLRVLSDADIEVSHINEVKGCVWLAVNVDNKGDEDG